MAVYWMTEVIPMAVTAMLPIVIFPWLGVLDTRKACQNYFKVNKLNYLSFLWKKFENTLSQLLFKLFKQQHKNQ